MIDPANEGGDFDVDAGNVLASTAETPADQPRQLVVACILTNQRAAAITLQKMAGHKKTRIRERKAKRHRSSSTVLKIFSGRVTDGLAWNGSDS